MIKDDLLFVPYPIMGGWQCLIKTDKGDLSIRYGASGLIADAERPYEVFYPEEDAPSGYQTAGNIWEYIKTVNVIQ